MADLNADLMRAIAPHNSGSRGNSQSAIIDAIGPVLATTLPEFEINTDLRAAHFLAQTCHESDGFVTTEEYASGAAYEGRKDLGNIHPGDGRKYKGRGLIQLTGRLNYCDFGKKLGLNLVDDPEQAADPVTSLKIACAFWKVHNVNVPADDDDIVTVTKKINGGLNGLDSRRTYLARAKVALGMAPGAAVNLAHPLLRSGDSGPDVRTLQVKLNAHGAAIAADGEFGPGTLKAVIAFQTAAGLEPDGLVGGDTWARLG
jgi:putative chitinase